MLVADHLSVGKYYSVGVVGDVLFKCVHHTTLRVMSPISKSIPTRLDDIINIFTIIAGNFRITKCLTT